MPRILLFARMLNDIFPMASVSIGKNDHHDALFCAQMRKPTKDEAMPIVQRLDAQQATLSAFELEDALGARALLDAESFLGAKLPFWQERL